MLSGPVAGGDREAHRAGRRPPLLGEVTVAIGFEWRCWNNLFTALLAGTAVVALAMAFRWGMDLLGIYSLLRSEGEEVVITLMAVLVLN